MYHIRDALSEKNALNFEGQNTAHLSRIYEIAKIITDQSVTGPSVLVKLLGKSVEVGRKNEKNPPERFN